MLTSIGRVAAKRLAASVAFAATSSGRIVITQARVIARGPLQHNLGSVRGLATAGRPAKTTATATKKPAAKKAPAAKKTTTKKTTATKAKAKAQPKSKAKAKAKPKAKAAAKPRRKKILSEEDKAKLEKRELKKTAIFEEPKRAPSTPWQLYVAEKTKGTGMDQQDLRTRMSSLAAGYKALSTAELRQLDETVQRNKLNNAAAYKAWVETLTPVEVAAANRARNLLKRKYNFPKVHAKLIEDDRLPKRPATAYVLFTKARWSSGEITTGIQVAASQIAQEWKTLPEADKKQYTELARADLQRYEKQVKAVLGRDITASRASAHA